MPSEHQNLCYESDSDEHVLIDDDSSRPFQPPRSEDLGEAELLQANLRKWQKQYLLLFSSIVPTVKFLLACVVLSIFASYNTLGYDLTHRPKGTYIEKGDILYLYLILTLAVSSITLSVGILIFAQFPKVTKTAIDGYIMFRSLVLIAELTVWFVCLAQFSFSIKEHIAAGAAVISEAQSIILLKAGSSHRYNSDPVEEPCTMEMTTIKTTNLTKGLKPVPRVAPRDIENP